MLGLLAYPYQMTSVDASGSAAAADFPKANLANNDYGRVTRSTSGAVSSYGWVYDLGEAKPVDTLGLLWHNLRSTDLVLFRAGATAADAIAGVLYASPNRAPITAGTMRETPAPGKCLLTLDEPVTARYWYVRSQVVGTAHPDGFVQASRFFVGKRSLFQIGPQRAELSAVDLNQKVQLETGQDRSTEDTGQILPVASLDFRYAKESEMAEVLGKYTLGLGVSRPMLVVPDLTSAYLQDQIVLGRPEKIINLQSEIYDIWQFQAVVKSLGP